MIDLSSEMAELEARLGPPPGAFARLIQFVSPTPGEGASTVARAFAFNVAQRARKPVWLVELDLLGNAQFEAIDSEPDAYGLLGPALRASMNGSVFFQVEGAEALPPSGGSQASFLAF